MSKILCYPILILSLILAVSPLYAQNDPDIPADIKWGPEMKEPGNSMITKIIGTTPKGFYTLREKTGGGLGDNGTTKIRLEYYNNDMKIMKSNEIALKYKSKKMSFEDVFFLNGKIYLFSSFHNEAKKKNYLFMQEVSIRSLAPRKNLKLLAEMDTRNKKRGIFDNHISRDSSKILIYNQLPYKKKQPERFALRVYDNEFNELWNRDISLPYNDEKFSIEEYQVDNNGNVFLLGVIYEDKSRVRRNGRPTYEYTILTYTEDGEDAQEYKIRLDQEFLTDMTFRVADNGDLVCSGFYSERGTYSVKGTCFFRIDTESKEIYNLNLKEFDFDFITEYLSDKKKEKLKNAERKGNKKKAPELYRYSLDKLILRSDGGALLIAEQYFVQIRDNFDRFNPAFGGFDPYWNGVRNQDYLYNYNDIIIVNIRPDGEIEWTGRIPKRQVTVNDGGYFSSYAMSIIRDKIYFVYNDNGRNFEEANSDRIYSYNGKYSVIALTELNRDGSMITYPLFSNAEAEIITRPKICKQIGKKDMVIYGERGRKYKFASLQFN
ncbi:MAG: hypothetical protein AAGG75_20495 [Bacteroidota bacterium]